MPSYYVRRVKETTPGGFAYVGPIRSERQAEKEADAWNSCSTGYAARVLPSNPATRKLVREWTRAVRRPALNPYAHGGPLWADGVRFTR